MCQLAAAFGNVRGVFVGQFLVFGGLEEGHDMSGQTHADGVRFILNKIKESTVS